MNPSLKKQLTARIRKKYKTPEEISRGSRKLRAWLWANQVQSTDETEHAEWIEYMQLYTVMIDMLRKSGITEEKAQTYTGDEHLEVYEQQFMLAYPHLIKIAN